MNEQREFPFSIRLEGDLRKMHNMATLLGLEWNILEPVGPMDEDAEPTGYVETGPAADASCRVDTLILFRMVGILAEKEQPQDWSLWVRGKTHDGAAVFSIPLQAAWWGKGTSPATVRLDASVIASELSERIDRAKAALSGREEPF